MTAAMNLQQIHLRDAYLCANCDTIGNSAVCCPACASQTSLLSLNGLLGTLERLRKAPARKDSESNPDQMRSA